MQDSYRVRLKGHYDQFAAGFYRQFLGGGQNGLMADMHTVEIADG